MELIWCFTAKDIAKKVMDEYPRNRCLGCKSKSMAIADHLGALAIIPCELFSIFVLGSGCSGSAEDMFRHWYRKAEKEVMGAGDWTDSQERNEFKKKVWRRVLLSNGLESDSDD